LRYVLEDKLGIKEGLYNLLINVIIDASWMQHGLGQRVMMIWSAMPQVSQSVPHVVDATSLC